MRPRPYQIEAVESTIDVLFNKHGTDGPICPIVAMPTGTGKSSVIAWTKRAIMQRIPRARLFSATHVKELVEQDSSELQRIWPNAPFGIYSAGLGTKQVSMPITFASVQSAVKNLGGFGKQSALFIDEAHMLSPREESNYQLLIAAFRKLNPEMPVIGYSATPWRLGQGLLTEGNIFNHIAFDNTSKDKFVALIDDGYLCPLIPKATTFQFDVSQVRKVGGDFNRGDLEKAVNVDDLTMQAIQEALQCASMRQHWVIFCSGIDHVESVTAILEMLGERAVAVHSKMPSSQRDLAIAAFKSGAARMIVNEGILTTGFNSPWIDCIVLLRPTVSPGLHVQIMGRGTRPYYATGYTPEMLEDKKNRLDAIALSSKQNCLVLDFAGNTLRLGPINDPRIPKKKGKGGGDVPVKICPECGSYVHAAVRFCDGINWDGSKCGHEFQFTTKLEQTAATVEVIARDAPMLHWFPVNRVEYEVYTKPFAPATMRVKYYSGLRRFTEMVCIEHQTYAGKRARDWWRQRFDVMGVDYEPPPNTHAGMTFVDRLPKPTHIYVHLNAGGRYENVIAHSFDGTTPTLTVKQASTHG